MLPTPYAYGVGNTYSVDDVFYTVGLYSVGICCGYMLWATYVVGICCGKHDHILWVLYGVDIYCGRHSIYCGSYKYIYTVGDILWTTAIYDVGNI